MPVSASAGRDLYSSSGLGRELRGWRDLQVQDAALVAHVFHDTKYCCTICWYNTTPYDTKDTPVQRIRTYESTRYFFRVVWWAIILVYSYACNADQQLDISPASNEILINILLLLCCLYCCIMPDCCTPLVFIYEVVYWGEATRRGRSRTAFCCVEFIGYFKVYMYYEVDAHE